MANEIAVETVKNSLLNRLRPGISNAIESVVGNDVDMQNALVLMPDARVNEIANKLCENLGNDLRKLLMQL